MKIGKVLLGLDEIRFALLIDLRKVFKDVSQREKVAGQLVEEVIKPMVECN